MDLTGKESFEKLDWITQATMPMNAEVNTIIANMHEKINIKLDEKLAQHVLNGIGHYSSNAHLRIENFMALAGSDRFVSSEIELLYDKIPYEEKRLINKCFKLSVKPGTYHAVSGEASGEIYLERVKNFFTEEELINIVLGCTFRSKIKEGDHTALNDILDLIGKTEERRPLTSVLDKRKLLNTCIDNIIKENAWLIKDFRLLKSIPSIFISAIDELMRKNSYCDKKNYTKLCLLIVRKTHGLPIFNLE